MSAKKEQFSQKVKMSDLDQDFDLDSNDFSGVKADKNQKDLELSDNDADMIAEVQEQKKSKKKPDHDDMAPSVSNDVNVAL